MTIAQGPSRVNARVEPALGGQVVAVNAVTRAAKLLDVDRVTVYNKIKKHGL